MATQRKMLFCASLLAALLVAMPASANSIQIDINTSALSISGQNWDLAFDLIDGNPQSNSVLIKSFSITGGALTGAAGYPMLSGGASGNLSVAPNTVTLTDLVAFNEYLDNANIGTSLSFILEFTNNKDAGLTPDAFSFFFLDSSGIPLGTADPTGAGALFVYSIGNDNQPEKFCPTTAPCVTVTPVQQGVPEPGALALAIAGLLAFGARRAARTSIA